MAFEPNMRADMAGAAKERLRRIAGRDASSETWADIFAELSRMPE
jgi:hypothetical protein